jgi:hypothetical protein
LKELIEKLIPKGGVRKNAKVSRIFKIEQAKLFKHFYLFIFGSTIFRKALPRLITGFDIA